MDIALPKISKQELLEAISEGVYHAIWQMITNDTSAPCADFFETVKQGVAQGIEAAARKGDTPAARVT